MIYSYIAPALPDELEQLKKLIAANKNSGKKTVIFCEDRLTLVAERAVCAATGGSFDTAVYTFARFLSNESGGKSGVISSRGSAMAIRAIIEKERDNLHLFKRLAASAAAQSLYDTIAILYASGVDIEGLISVDAGSPILTDKLHDISYVYTRYMQFLQNCGRTDRNMYLRLLPDLICKSKITVGADIILLGFQAFTGTTTQCVRACMRAAENVYGLFKGGDRDIYANEAAATFEGCAKEYGGCMAQTLESNLSAEAEHIRQNLFNPQSFNKAAMPTANVHIFEGADEAQELTFIAANIKKHVIDDGIRYAQISVMLPGADYARGTLARVFSDYRIPYYVDERRSMESHPLTAFIESFIECVAGGCAPDDVNAAAGSFLFGLTQKERDIYRNYLVRCADYRGGVKRVPAKGACEALGFDFDAVNAVRERFLKGLELLPKGAASISDWTAGIAELTEFFDCKNVLETLAEGCKDDYPAQSQFYLKAYDAVMSVIEEAQEIVPDEKYTAREYKKLIKSGFAAAEISLIPPKTDAVFVGDISATVNAGSEIVFACGLTDAVPPAGADTALLTDREITSLEQLNLQISPKIAQVNKRAKETVALNLCAFKRHLYISYPVQSGGQEQTKSEIVTYISRLFAGSNGKNLTAVTEGQIAASGRGLPYYCSEETPALNILASGTLNGGEYSAVYKIIEENGGGYAADKALAPPKPKDNIDCGKQLFTGGKPSVYPTLLETYFTCPYKNFLSRGVKLADRKEGEINPIDTGNFIHEVLNKMTPLFTSYGDDADFKKEEKRARETAREIAENLLKTPQYSSLGGSGAGEYTAGRLITEAQEVAAGACEQILAGGFRVRDSEKWYDLPLEGGIKVGGKIDRVDAAKDGMVRVIDYKTGSVDSKMEPYYAGTKLQLPLYLSAAAGKNRAAGAYYFPANIEYKEDDGVFTLQGFMDCSPDVVSASDHTIEEGKSRYITAKLSGNRAKNNMSSEVFNDFLGYSRLIARQGAKEIFSGNICPSPYGGVCKYCGYGGMCGFSQETDDVRMVEGVTGEKIADIVRREREKKEGKNG